MIGDRGRPWSTTVPTPNHTGKKPQDSGVTLPSLSLEGQHLGDSLKSDGYHMDGHHRFSAPPGHHDRLPIHDCDRHHGRKTEYVDFVSTVELQGRKISQKGHDKTHHSSRTVQQHGVGAKSSATSTPAVRQTTPSSSSQSTTLPSLSRTLAKLDDDRSRCVKNTLHLVHRAEQVAHFAHGLVKRHRQSHRQTNHDCDSATDGGNLVKSSDSNQGNCDSATDVSNLVKSSDSNGGALPPLSPEGHNSAKGGNSSIQHWAKKISWVWAFLVKEIRVVEHHMHQESLEQEASLPGTSGHPVCPGSSNCTGSTAASPSESTEAQILSNINTRSSNSTAASSMGKTDESKIIKQDRSSSHKQLKSNQANLKAHSGPAETAWIVEDSHGDFSDENLGLLFTFFSNHKDYAGRALMANQEWHTFFRKFAEHFEGITPSSEKLNDFFTKNLNLQIDMHFAHGMEIGEASRGLTFASFKVALHEAIGHHWHKADMLESWNSAMNRQPCKGFAQTL